MPCSSRAQNKAVKAPEPVLASLHRRRGPKNRKICGTATSFGPARYNVNMYHAENMLQTSASKHAYREDLAKRPGSHLGPCFSPPGTLGTRSGPVRDPFGTRSGHVRDTFGTRSGHVRDTFGTRSGHVRDTFGTRSGHVRDMLGMDPGHCHHQSLHFRFKIALRGPPLWLIS